MTDRRRIGSSPQKRFEQAFPDGLMTADRVLVCDETDPTDHDVADLANALRLVSRELTIVLQHRPAGAFTGVLPLSQITHVISVLLGGVGGIIAKVATDVAVDWLKRRFAQTRRRVEVTIYGADGEALSTVGVDPEKNTLRIGSVTWRDEQLESTSTERTVDGNGPLSQLSSGDSGQSESRPALPLSQDQPDKVPSAVIAALNSSGGNRTRAARRLGISRATLASRMREYGISVGATSQPVASEVSPDSNHRDEGPPPLKKFEAAVDELVHSLAAGGQVERARTVRQETNSLIRFLDPRSRDE